MFERECRKLPTKALLQLYPLAVSGEPELLSRKMDQVVATLIVNTVGSAGYCHAAVC